MYQFHSFIYTFHIHINIFYYYYIIYIFKNKNEKWTNKADNFFFEINEGRHCVLVQHFPTEIFKTVELNDSNNGKVPTTTVDTLHLTIVSTSFDFMFTFFSWLKKCQIKKIRLQTTFGILSNIFFKKKLRKKICYVHKIEVPIK